MASWRAGRPPGPLSTLGVGVAASVVVVDQATKLAAELWLAWGSAIQVLPILILYRVHNEGIAFSLLAGFGPSALIWLMVAVTAIVLVMWVSSRDGGWPSTLGYALIVGGALGNLIDRVRFGYVVDFLLLHIGNWTLFVFNLADAALTLGPVILLAVYLIPSNAD